MLTVVPGDGSGHESGKGGSPSLIDCDGVSAPYKINRHPVITTPFAGRAPGTVPRQAARTDGCGTWAAVCGAEQPTGWLDLGGGAVAKR